MATGENPVRADLAWDVEEACFNARPSPLEILLSGWVLRAAGGPTRRTNSLNPLRGGRGEPRSVLAEAERLYTRLGQSLIVRLPTLVSEMGEALDPGRYRHEGETCTLFADLGATAAVATDTVLLPEPDPSWFAAWAACDGVACDVARTAYRESVQRIALPKRFAIRRRNGEPVAVAYGVLHLGLLVLESVATHREHRRQGHGAGVVEALRAWARDEGAYGACLQVTAANAPALALYRRLGFSRELYRYRYWRRD